MGCWNATCQISQLPIMAGEKVRFLLLTHSPYTYSLLQRKDESNYCGEASKDGCYSTDFWFPRTVPIRAKYNDYGSVEELEEGLNLKIWFDGLKEDLIETPAGKNKYRQQATQKNMTIEEFLEVLQEGLILVDGDYTGNYDRIDKTMKKSLVIEESIRKKEAIHLPVCQAMIREDVYQSLLKMPIETWAGTNTVQQTRSEVKKWFLDLTKNINDINEDVLETEFLKNASRLSGNERSSTFRLESIPFTIGLGYYSDWLIDKIYTKEITRTDKDVLSLVKDMADFTHVFNCASFLRKTWGPQTGAGSQDINANLHKSFHSKISSIANKIHRKYSNQ